MSTITYSTNPALDDATLNALFQRSWPAHEHRTFAPVLERSTAFFAAFDGPHLVGFINLITDGGAHAFLLDPTVDPDYRRRGIGLALVERAIAVARTLRCDWVHVDYEPTVAAFYAHAGFRGTHAAVLRLDPTG